MPRPKLEKVREVVPEVALDVVKVLVMDYLIRRTFSSVGLMRSVVTSATNFSGQ